MTKNPKDNPEPAQNPPVIRLADLRENVRDLEHLLSDVRTAAEDGDLEEVTALLDDYFAPNEDDDEEQ